MTLPVYVVSLQYRIDRRKAMFDGLTALSLDFTFVDAFDIKNYNKAFETNFEVSKHAIWRSHVLAYENFLTSNSQWGVILEDDIDFSNSVLLSQMQLKTLTDAITEKTIEIDMFQFGYNSDKAETFRQLISDLFFSAFRFRRYDWPDLFSLLKKQGPGKLILLSLLISMPSKRVLLLRGHSERGTHYYLINRSLATSLTEYFYQNSRSDDLMPLDTYLHKLSFSSHEIVRPSIAFALQSNSISDNIG
jgi:GR25 family glycosyltransferase involved in LPS biosynthesis